jgi:5-methylcytosine-specific restriction protein A
MNVTDTLKPHESQRVMDLVSAAGVDVSPWGVSSKGKVRVPASNPAYCYEWAFVDPGKLVVLNVWHRQLEERNGKVWCDLNLRAWSEEGKNAKALHPSERGALSKRALRMDEAIASAYKEGLTVRLIIGEGSQRDITDPKSRASRMALRLLDPKPWTVERYNQNTGECCFVRGIDPQYVDQFATGELRLPNRQEVTGKVWERDPRVRAVALSRARGRCELCNQPGFRMAGGNVYLETHHVVPLSEGGVDHESNVVALCPNDHREAHHGERRDAIRSRLLAMLAAVYVG